MQRSNDLHWDLDLAMLSRPFLDIPYAIMQRVCRFLPKQADRYQLCLVHPKWKDAAVEVLWETPAFPSPQSFRAFLTSIRSYKRLALYVRHLNLCLTAEEDVSVFEQPLSTALQAHAAFRGQPLALPQIILGLLRVCENLESLSIYGWQLQPAHLVQLTGYNTDIRSLRILGSWFPAPATPQVLPAVFKNLLPHLRELHLDAVFKYSPHFFAVLGTRCDALRSLRISLAGMTEENFNDLCSHRLSKVRRLRLAHATHIRDEHISSLFSTFPNLTKICLEDLIHITPAAFIQTARLQPSLKYVALRGTPNAAAQGLHKKRRMTISDDEIGSDLHLHGLLIQDMPIDDRELEYLLWHAESLQYLYVSGCPLLTDESIIRISKVANCLEELRVTRCENIGGQAIQSLAVGSVSRSLRELHVESCGAIDPMDVYKFASSAVNNRLSYMRFGGYDNLEKSVVGEFSLVRNQDEIDSDSSTLAEATVALDKHAIMEFVDKGAIPKERYLSSEHIIKLASRLGLSVRELQAILDEVQEEKPPVKSISPAEEDYSNLEGLDNDDQEDFDTSSNYEWPEQNREYSTDAFCSTPLPSKIESELIPANSHMIDEGLTRNGKTETESELVLGGWGESDATWTRTEVTASTANGANNYETSWEPKNFNDDTTLSSHERDTVAQLEFGEGWGTPKNVVDWQDERLSYAHYVLEKQKQTTFWNRRENGEWTELSQTAAVTAATRSRSLRSSQPPSRRSSKGIAPSKSHSSSASSRRLRTRSFHEHSDDSDGSRMHHSRSSNNVHESPNDNARKYARPATSMASSRSTGFRDHLQPEEMAGSWGEFANREQEERRRKEEQAEWSRNNIKPAEQTPNNNAADLLGWGTEDNKENQEPQEPVKSILDMETNDKVMTQPIKNFQVISSASSDLVDLASDDMAESEEEMLTRNLKFVNKDTFNANDSKYAVTNTQQQQQQQQQRQQQQQIDLLDMTAPSAAAAMAAAISTDKFELLQPSKTPERPGSVSSGRSSESSAQRKPMMIRVSLQTDTGVKELELSEDQDIEEKVRSFCHENGIHMSFEYTLKLVKEEFTRRIMQASIKKKKKSKKSRQEL